MPTLQNDRFIRALKREPVNTTPIWIMRQAGRYLPEYRELRAEAGSFMSLCTNPELACEVTLQPLRRFDLDAAILFSDILTIPDAMGLGLYFAEGEGPKFKQTVRTAADVDKLPIPDPEDSLGYVTGAVKKIQQELNGKLPLIGFAGSPWTVATYMVEGGSSKEFAKIKQLLYREPATLHALLDKLAETTALYLQAQIAAGVNAVMIFDTWGGALSGPAYSEFSLRYMEKIVDALGEQDLPVILFTKGGGQYLELMAATGCNALGLDWTQDIGQARDRVSDQVALQGNLDPGVLYGSRESIEQEVARILQSFGPNPGHVFNLGHGIHQFVDPDNVKILVDAVHQQSQQIHQV